MHPLIRRILRFDFQGKKERAEELAKILVNLEREGKIQIYETYEDGEWDFCFRRIGNQEEGEVKSGSIAQKQAGPEEHPKRKIS
jgi:hypothetical protein